jgi:rod shape-determining protein MreD
MKASLPQQLDTLARQLVPTLSVLTLLIASVVPLHVPALQSVTPSLPLIAMFYWTLHRPDLMPPFAAFAIGMLQDVLTGLPIGVSAIVLLAVHATVETQRRFFEDKSFGIVWLGFSCVALGAIALGWLLTCAYNGVLVTPLRIIVQVLMTVGCFPLLCRALCRCHRALPKQV